MKYFSILLAIGTVAVSAVAAPEDSTPSAEPKDSQSADTTQAVAPASEPAAKKSTPPSRPAATGVKLSPIVLAVAELSRAGVELPVIDAYVKEANVPPLRTDELIFLRQQKVSTEITTALIQRSVELRAGKTAAARNPAARPVREQPPQPGMSGSQNPVAGTAISSQQPVIFNYYVPSPAPYNRGNQFYPYAFVNNYPVYYYNFVRHGRVAPSQPALSPAAAQNVANRNANSSFFISKWQWNGNTGKPVDNR